MGRQKKSLDVQILEEIELAINNLPNGLVVRKLMIISAFSWMKAEDIARAYRINERTLFRWIEKFKKNGVEGLMNNPKGHRMAILTQPAKKAIVRWITTQSDEDGNEVYWTLEKLQQELERVFEIKISKPALSVNLKKMRIALRRPRPLHASADPEKQEEFKKKL